MLQEYLEIIRLGNDDKIHCSFYKWILSRIRVRIIQLKMLKHIKKSYITCKDLEDMSWIARYAIYMDIPIRKNLAMTMNFYHDEDKNSLDLSTIGVKYGEFEMDIDLNSNNKDEINIKFKLHYPSKDNETILNFEEIYSDSLKPKDIDESFGYNGIINKAYLLARYSIIEYLQEIFKNTNRYYTNFHKTYLKSHKEYYRKLDNAINTLKKLHTTEE